MGAPDGANMSGGPAPADDRSKTMGLARLAFIVLGPFAAGYFMTYLFRSVNAVVAPDLAADIGLTAGALGLLTAAYFFGYGAFQAPLGVLLDRYGPRRVQAALFTVAGAGALLFAAGRDQTVLTVARCLIGIGVAGGLMASFKQVVMWVPAPRVPLANGCIMAAGGTGSVVATAPTDVLVRMIGWRWTFVALAIVTFALALLIHRVAPDKAAPHGTAAWRDQIKAMIAILRDRYFWGIAPFVGVSCGIHLAFQTLWAGPWARDVLGLDRDGVAIRLAWLSVAFVVGALSGGVIADIARRRFAISTLGVMNVMVALFMVSHIALLFEATRANPVVWMAFGALGQLAIMAYPVASEHYGPALAGRANSALNLVTFLSAFT
ncbi:MAG: MFS transporter, partial [Alphaproteobacteria bacterium]|nr:MFS transporter [Alphaproteobacteria bacterium]